ncbi:MAG: hypothetical protein KC486_28190 [Myxococcales bacterium]|nr:hypothetical protein [Myxococcales bacterium]
MIKLEYTCFECERQFPIEVSDLEYRSSLSESHTETCPRCGLRPGYARVRCRRCGRRYVAFHPHAHVICTIVDTACPDCGEVPFELCTC